MKNRHNGWEARRLNREKDDLVAKVFGYPDNRSMRHARNAERLRAILKTPPDNDESELFVTREVADALDSTPKVIRWLVYCHHLAAEKLPGERARKLWFRAGAVRKYFDNSRRGFHAITRSPTVAENPHFRAGMVFTKDAAAVELNITKRGVEYYLARGILKKAQSSTSSNKRVVLITRESLAALAWKRIEKAERDYKDAARRYNLAAEKRKKICGANRDSGH